MASLSFAEAEKKDTAPEKAATTEVTPVPVADGINKETAVVPAPNRAPAAVYVENEDAEGEFSSRDIVWPGLSLVSKTSADAEVYGIGAWLVNKDTAVGKMDVPLKVIAVKIQKAYQEQVPFGTGVKARMFRTAAEVHEAGLSLEWDEEPRAAEVLGIRFWLPRPEGIDAPHVFSIEGPEGPGTIVKFFAAHTTYGTVGKTLIKAAQTHLRPDKGGLASGWWEMTATKERRNGNSWLLPRLKPAGKVNEALTAFLKELRV